jgi:hypothetical protein
LIATFLNEKYNSYQMSVSDLNRVSKALKNALKAYPFKEAIQSSGNESQTRELLIEPILKMLAYDKLKHWIAEADGGYGKRVDFALNPYDKSNGALVIIEAKEQSATLNEKHFAQLKSYFVNVTTAQFGILTNGVVWKFYCGDGNDDNLCDIPFLTFDVTDIGDSEVENLARFHTSIINPNVVKDIREDAQNIFEVAKFDEALFQEFKDPSGQLVKQILYRMGYSRSTPQREEFVRSNLNHFSLKDVSERMLLEASSAASLGIFTTNEELQAYRTVRTIILASSKALADVGDRIGYRDLKNQFSILFDDNQRKPICILDFNSSSKKIWIGGREGVPEIIQSTDDIVQFKYQLTDLVKGYLEE